MRLVGPDPNIRRSDSRACDLSSCCLLTTNILDYERGGGGLGETERTRATVSQLRLLPLCLPSVRLKGMAKRMARQGCL